jgi:hypothetical protein
MKTQDKYNAVKKEYCVPANFETILPIHKIQDFFQMNAFHIAH